MSSTDMSITLTAAGAPTAADWERVRTALSEHDGVVHLTIDAAAQQLQLRYDAVRLDRRKIRAITRAAGVELDDPIRTCSLEVAGLQTWDCPRWLERRLRRLEGVERAVVNAATGRALIEYDPAVQDPSLLQSALQSWGLGAENGAAAALGRRDPAIISALFCGFFLLLGVLAQNTAAPHEARVALFGVSYLAGGWMLARGAFRSLLGLAVDANVLALAAAIGAAYVGRWREGCVLLLAMAVSGLLQRSILAHTRRTAQALARFQPAPAIRVLEGESDEVMAETLAPGDHIRLRPGDIFPVDGEILQGFTHVDEFAITGAVGQLRRGPGDTVHAGAKNLEGTPAVRVTHGGADTLIARMRRSVEEAQAGKSPTQSVVEGFSRIYAPLALLSAIAVAMLPPLLWDANESYWMLRAVVLLVAASPGALLVAAPAAIAAGIANLARSGTLVRGAMDLEALGGARVMAFDKSGTLTRGHPEVREVRAVSGVESSDVLRVAASLESLSDRPVAQAIVREAQRRKLTLLPAMGLQAFNGRGVQGEVAGAMVYFGHESWASERGLSIPEELGRPANDNRRRGETIIWLFVEEVIGYVAILDPLREKSRETIDQIKLLGIERTALLTGDHRDTASALAREVGIDEVLANLMPEDKGAAVHTLAAAGPVAAVAEGSAESPALSRAAVGISLGDPSPSAGQDSAEITLLRNDLSTLVRAVSLAHRTRRVTRQSLAIAALVMLALTAGAFVAKLPLEYVALLHEASALLAALNGLRLLRNG